MSETTSPSVQLHPISPSSSLSSTDSAPHSEPTSDEQPDLGAFTTVLREWTHLQPPPRIPVQIRSATSSTTPTFQPSVVGSDLHSRSARSRHSRVTSHSAISSFTRPPSSSAHPEGSTVWNQAPIASYLFSGTPSNDDEEEEYESPGGEGEYTPNSVASTGLTVEIASELDFPSFDDDSQGRVDSSPYPYPMDSGVAVPVPLESESQRLDSRETAHPEDEIEGSETSRDQPFTATSTRHSSQAESLLTSIHLQSQARPTTTANSSSSSLPLSTAAAIPSVASVSNFVSDSPPTFIHALLNRSRNPMPPRTTSDSSFTTSGSASSSNLSLLSYQIPETPPIIVDEESEMPDPSLLQPSTSVSADSATRSALSASSGSGSVSLKTQRSIPTSSSESTSTASFATQRPQQPIQRSFHPSVTGSQPSSVSSTGSPLPNPHSPLPTPEPEPEAPAEINTSRRPIVATSGWRQDIIVNDLGTPDQPPSETFLFDPPRERRSEFQPVVDDDDEDVRIDRNSAAAYGFGLGHSEDPNSKNAARQTSQSSGYASGYDRPALSSERGHGYSQAAVHLERNPRLEPHNEDEDELDEDEDDYPYRYPYSHVLTPRSIGPALTPRGVPPPQPIDPRSQTQTQTATTTTTTTTTSVSQANSLLQQLGLSNQSVYVQHETTSQPQLQPPAQSQSQSQSQHNRTNANLNSSQIALQSQPTAEQPPSSSSSYTYTPYTPPATQSSTGNISQPPSQQPYSSSSQYDIPQIQPQTQTETYSGHRHGYPHSLLGLHALPASLVPPEPGELPPPLSSFGFDASEARSTGGPQAQTRTQAPRQTSDQLEYNISLSDDNTNTTTDTAEAAYAVAAAEDIPVEQVVPSLGVLDGVLSFIAVERERARHNAARDGPASTSAAADVDDSRGAGSGEDGEGLEGEEDWKNAVENEHDQPKRKRRRKRPPRSHGAATATVQAQAPPSSLELPKATSNSRGESHVNDATGTRSVPTSSPKRKKRSKSASASTSASVNASVHSLLDSETSKTANKMKGKEKEFLIPAPRTLGSARAEKERDKPPVMILRRPVELLTKAKVLSEDDDRDGDSDADGGRTPTHLDANEGGKSFGTSSAESPINLTGKKGKRVGRRERGKEKMKRDLMKLETGAKEDEDAAGDDIEFGIEYDDDGNDDGLEPQEEEDDEQGDDNDSLSNLSLLQPPRRKRDRSRRRKPKDTAYIHDVASVGGAYKSTPGTPGHLKEVDHGQVADDMDDEVGLDADVGRGHVDEDDVFGSKPNDAPVGEKKKRTRTKRIKAVARSRSVPDLKVDTKLGESAEAPAGDDTLHPSVGKSKKGKNKADTHDGEDILEMDRNQLQTFLSVSSASSAKSQPPPESKRGRLLSLAKQLRQLFPEQREELGRVITRLEKQGAAQGPKSKKVVAGDTDEGNAPGSVNARPISIPAAKRKRARKAGHVRTGSEGTTGGEGFEFDDEFAEAGQVIPEDANRFPDIDEEEEEEIDPRGRPPKRGDVLVHVFIDHSNILIGLLSHLKRNPPYRRNVTNIVRGRPLPTVLAKATTSTTTSDKPDPVSAFAAVKSTTTRPLPIPANGETGTTPKRQNPAPAPKAGSHPIPLPSFATATVSRSLPTGSVLSTYMARRHNKRSSDDTTARRETEANSDGLEYSPMDNEEADTVAPNSLFVGSLKNNREKKAPRHLWHAALTLILERGRPVTRRVVVTSSPLYQPMDSIEHLGYELRVFIRVPDLGDGQDRERYRDKDKNGYGKSGGGSKSSQSSPVTTTSSSTFPLSLKKGKTIAHVRQVSGSESGSGGTGSGNASGGGSLHPYYGITANSTPQAKVKFREQGVDELLQLKLHQALAATDDVPEGSTIVLATGDGNMGQFNEDGFLGPVRTALRRGWKVELYAWEDGLSRAWKREFGDGSEWGRRGMFRVIGMEQFASGLVEAGQWY